MKLGMRGQLTDKITCVKFLFDRLRGYGVLTPTKLPFPIDLLRRPYNSVRTNVLHCDRKIVVADSKYVVSDDHLPPGHVIPRMRISNFAFKMAHSHCFQP